MAGWTRGLNEILKAANFSITPITASLILHLWFTILNKKRLPISFTSRDSERITKQVSHLFISFKSLRLGIPILPAWENAPCLSDRPLHVILIYLFLGLTQLTLNFTAVHPLWYFRKCKACLG